MNTRNQLEIQLRKYITKLNNLSKEPLKLDLDNLSFYELWEEYIKVLEIPREYFDLYIQEWIDKRFSRNEILDPSEVNQYLLEEDVFDPCLVLMGIQSVLYDEKEKIKTSVNDLEASLKRLEEAMNSENWAERHDAIYDLAYDERTTKNEIYIQINKIGSLDGVLSRLKVKHDALCDEDGVFERK